MKITFAWNELPFYGEKLLKRAIRKLRKHEISIISTKPEKAVESTLDVAGKQIHWISAKRIQTWGELGLEVPDLLFHTGWAYPVFNDLGNQVRRSGGNVVCMIDNSWKANFRQLIGSVYYRLFLSEKFIRVMVPGYSAHKFCRFLGIPDNQITQGLYGADPLLFSGGLPLEKRPKKLVFVGQFIIRKNLENLISAWAKFVKINEDWELNLIGDGELRESIPELPRMVVKGFQSPENLVEILRTSRILVLPSFEEHWGVVVHEAALCGCGLILSKNVGSRFDLGSKKNCLLLKSTNPASIVKSLIEMSEFDDSKWRIAESESRKLASGFGPEVFARAVNSIIEETGCRH